jgi:glyoxylase-like metal-dependent hydrolase (beta-lactamase superfamily II)
MDTVVPGLYASAQQALPFAPTIDMRAFLCQRDQGNLLIYSAGTLESERRAIEQLGGVAHRYLGHWHEAQFATDHTAAPLVVHERERSAVSEKLPVDRTFSHRHTVDDDFEVIPTPGHTPGATAYLWSSAEHRVLFTGDTIYLTDRGWIAAVLDSSDRHEYIASLELIRELDFDVLVPWIAAGTGPFFATTDRSDARRRIDAILNRLERGETS